MVGWNRQYTPKGIGNWKSNWKKKMLQSNGNPKEMSNLFWEKEVCLKYVCQQWNPLKATNVHLKKHDTRQKVDSNFKKPSLNPNILVDNDQILKLLLWFCFVNMVWIWGEVRNSKFPQWCCSGSRSNQICKICNNLKKSNKPKRNYFVLTLLCSVIAWHGVDTSQPAKRKLLRQRHGQCLRVYRVWVGIC